MENASLDLLNQLSRFPGRFTIGATINGATDNRMFGEVSPDEMSRDEKFQRRCIFVAGTALVLAWCAQVSRYFGHDALPMFPVALTASVFLPITFAISCLPACLVWVKLLHRRPGGLVALASILCSCWSAAELLLGVPLP
jgi:hypothetical protein